MFFLGVAIIVLIWMVYILGIVFNKFDIFELVAWIIVYPVFGLFVTVLIFCILGWIR